MASFIENAFDRFATQAVVAKEAAITDQLRRLAGGDVFILYPDDWVLLYDGPSESTAVSEFGTIRMTITQRVPRICPRSLYEESLLPEGQRHRWNQFLRTGEIPPDCPELRRICAIRNAAK